MKDLDLFQQALGLSMPWVVKASVFDAASKRGHNYVTTFVDLTTSKVVFVSEGKDAATVQAFRDHFVTHKGKEENIKEFCSDMSPAFIKGISTYFPKAHLTFDKFHIMQVITKAVDEVRRQEQKERPELEKSRYLWLKNKENLKASQLLKLEHWHGILRWFTSNIANRKLEGLNSMIQAAKARARGYRSIHNLIAMIYLIGGKLEFGLPSLTHSK